MVATVVVLSGCTLINSTAEFGDPLDGGSEIDSGTDASVGVDARVNVDASSPDAGSRDAGARADGGCTGECMPGESGSGLNACGNSAPRTCTEDCSWGPYVLVESAATCDYCDDDPSGFRERASGFANVERSYNVVPAVGGTGNPTSQGGEAIATCTEWCHVDLAFGSQGVGGTFMASPAPLGWSGGTISASVRSQAGGSNPGPGWAFVAYQAPTPSPLIGAASELGVNRGADGFAVEWFQTGSDVVRLRRLDSAGPDPIVVQAATGRGLTGPAGTLQYQDLTISWTPDDPLTPANETGVSITYPCPIAGTCSPIACGGTSGTNCGFTLRPGELITYGIVGGSTDPAPRSFRVEGLPTGLNRVTISGACP